MTQEWWENFFDGIALEMWRQVFSEEQTQAEADFLQKVLALAPPAKVLDVPCGEGRLSLALAALGFHVTGLDFSAAFLEEARRKASAKGMNINWKQGDMRRMDWAEEFDGAVCMGGSFGYFDDAGHAGFLKSVFRALKPGGRFVLDASRVVEAVLPVAREREWVRVGDILFLEENQWDHINGRMETEYTFVRNGKEEKKASSDRIYTYREICCLLDDAGFASTEAYSSYALEPFKLGSGRLFLIGQKS
jgi:cyclopropane fatty-acyl-phospholipid synthase-like methyltransferase